MGGRCIRLLRPQGEFESFSLPMGTALHGMCMACVVCLDIKGQTHNQSTYGGGQIGNRPVIRESKTG